MGGGNGQYGELRGDSDPLSQHNLQSLCHHCCVDLLLGVRGMAPGLGEPGDATASCPVGEEGELWRVASCQQV